MSDHQITDVDLDAASTDGLGRQILGKLADALLACASVGAAFAIYSYAATPETPDTSAATSAQVTDVRVIAASAQSLESSAAQYRNARLELGAALGQAGTAPELLTALTDNEAYFEFVENAGTGFIQDRRDEAREELEYIRNRLSAAPQVTDLDRARMAYEEARLSYYTQMVRNRELQRRAVVVR